jgi:hypothetical protein
MSLSRIFPTIISSEITAGNALIDSTTANAFIAPVGVDLSPYRGKFMELWSGSTLWAQAWISATAPSGESLTDVLTYATLNLTSGWTTVGATITDADSFVNTASGGHVYKNHSGAGLLAGKLLKSVITATVSEGTVTVMGTNGAPYYATNGAGDRYDTAISSLLFLRNAGGIGATTDITALNVASVDMPAATGALLLSTQGGSRGWAYKHASFNPNAALTMRILAKRKVSGNGSYLV